MKRLDAQRSLAIGAGLVIVGLTAAAFWLSYSHLAGVAEAYGLQSSPVRAWAWPACLDLFIVAGELLMLRAALTQDVDPWAIGLTIVGSGGSIALNVAGVGTHAPVLTYVVAAVPPTAALLAFGALMRQVHQALIAPTEPETVDVIHGFPKVAVERVPAPVLAAEQSRTRVSAAVPEADDVLVERVRDDFAGRIPTYRELKEKYGIGQPRARRIRAVLENGLTS